MDIPTEFGPVKKIATGIRGFDDLAEGGLPRHRTTLVVGTSGSCKTIFALECIWRGIVNQGRPAVLVSLEEEFGEICRNVGNLGWNLAAAARDRQLQVIEVDPESATDVETGSCDLGDLVARIEDAIDATKAELVVIDALGSLFTHVSSDLVIRREIQRLTRALAKREVTIVLTAERLYEYGAISRHGIEEYVSDCVVVLRNVLEEERCRRTLQILKMRGSSHAKGELPFTFAADGLQVLPIVSTPLAHASSMTRLKSGNAELDEITGGGFFRDSIILCSGATGTGKTLLSTTFANAGCANGERTLMLAYEESRPQLSRNAQGWGMDFESWERQGLLRVSCAYPEGLGLEDHLVRIRNAIEEFRPVRLVIDSLSALERGGNIKLFREFVIGVSALVKEKSVCTLLTSTTPGLAGGESITEAHISTLTDAIILLRYVETSSRLRRGIGVIKMRGSAHDKDVHEYSIDGAGMHIGAPFKHVQGIILGTPHSVGNEEDDLGEVFGP